MLAGKARVMLTSSCRRLSTSADVSRKLAVAALTPLSSSGQSPLVRCHSTRSGQTETNKNDHNITKQHQQQRHLSTNTSTISRNASSSSSSAAQRDDDEPEFHPIYVHHVSRVALEHLQDNRSDWLVARGLDRNLQIRNNGTFLLDFPEYGRVWTSYDSHKRQHWLLVYRNKLAVRFLLKDHDRAAKSLQEHQQQQQQQHQHQSPPSVASVQEFHASSVQKIQLAVDEMIRAVEAIEAKKQTTEAS